MIILLFSDSFLQSGCGRYSFPLIRTLDDGGIPGRTLRLLLFPGYRYEHFFDYWCVCLTIVVAFCLFAFLGYWLLIIVGDSVALLRAFVIHFADYWNISPRFCFARTDGSAAWTIVFCGHYSHIPGLFSLRWLLLFCSFIPTSLRFISAPIHCCCRQTFNFLIPAFRHHSMAGVVADRCRTIWFWLIDWLFIILPAAVIPGYCCFISYSLWLEDTLLLLLPRVATMETWTIRGTLMFVAVLLMMISTDCCRVVVGILFWIHSPHSEHPVPGDRAGTLRGRCLLYAFVAYAFSPLRLPLLPYRAYLATLPGALREPRYRCCGVCGTRSMRGVLHLILPYWICSFNICWTWLDVMAGMHCFLYIWRTQSDIPVQACYFYLFTTAVIVHCCTFCTLRCLHLLIRVVHSAWYGYYFCTMTVVTLRCGGICGPAGGGMTGPVFDTDGWPAFGDEPSCLDHIHYYSCAWLIVVESSRMCDVDSVIAACGGWPSIPVWLAVLWPRV